MIGFSPHFHPFFTTRPTSESYNDSLKVPTEGSRVEYLPVGSQEATQTISAKIFFSSPEILNYNPSPLCSAFYTKLLYVFLTNFFQVICIFYWGHWAVHFTLVLKMANAVFYTRFLGEMFSLHFTLDQDPKQCILY